MFVVQMLYHIAGILLGSALICITEIIHGFNFDESGPHHMNTPYKSIRIQFLRIALEGRPRKLDPRKNYQLYGTYMPVHIYTHKMAVTVYLS